MKRLLALVAICFIGLNLTVAQDRPLRFAVTGDTHFDMPPESDQWRNVVELNRLDLDGVAIVGDVFDRQHADIVNLFRRRYEQSGGDGDSTLRSQLYIGLGNHDINPVSRDSVLNVQERAITLRYVDSLLGSMVAEGLITNFHAPTRNYSFDLGGLHFIQSNTWAGDRTLGDGGLEWLSDDLANHAADGKAVVLLMHYTFNATDKSWINDVEREQLYGALRGYNIVAIFNGHDHSSMRSTWRGIPVYQCDNTWVDGNSRVPSFWVIEYLESVFSVRECFWATNGTPSKLGFADVLTQKN